MVGTAMNIADFLGLLVELEQQEPDSSHLLLTLVAPSPMLADVRKLGPLVAKRQADYVGLAELVDHPPGLFKRVVNLRQPGIDIYPLLGCTLPPRVEPIRPRCLTAPGTGCIR